MFAYIKLPLSLVILVGLMSGVFVDHASAALVRHKDKKKSHAHFMLKKRTKLTLEELKNRIIGCQAEEYATEMWHYIDQCFKAGGIVSMSPGQRVLLESKNHDWDKVPEELAVGLLSHMTQDLSDDEIGQLVQAFAESLQHIYLGLSKLVWVQARGADNRDKVELTRQYMFLVLNHVDNTLSTAFKDVDAQTRQSLMLRMKEMLHILDKNTGLFMRKECEALFSRLVARLNRRARYTT